MKSIASGEHTYESLPKLKYIYDDEHGGVIDL